jgi:2-polyprenyl-6-methoxyphenol hydroxylase-like FAD-dependent oxidoreductase
MSFEVVVVGGGFTGMAAAAALAQKGARVTVLEASQSTPPQFRGELIHPKGVRALDVLGLKAPLFEAGGVAVHGFAVTPDADADAVVLPYTDSAGPGLGIDHPEMVLTMRREVAKRPGVSVATGARVVDFVREGERITGVKRADGEVYRADLVVVADGRQSKLRPLLGLKPEVKLLSHTVAVAVEGDLLPWGMNGHVFLGAPGPILAYPYAHQKIRFCIDVPVGLAKGKAAFIELLTTRYAPFVPRPLRDAMVRALAEKPFEAVATHSISTDACAAPGVVLVGDAGGCAHPLTASGMTNALNDVLSLAAVVGEAGPSDAALEDYQRRRYDFIRMRELFTDALYEVFRAHDSGSKALQAGVFRYWKSSARSRQASMDILSGEDVRTSRFVAEYSRVFGLSALEVLTRLKRRAPLKDTTATMRSLVKTSFGRFEAAMGHTARRVVDRYRLKLHRVPAAQPSA